MSGAVKTRETMMPNEYPFPSRQPAAPEPFAEPPEPFAELAPRAAVPSRQVPDIDYSRPPTPITAFAFQHKDVFELARAFDFIYDAVDAVVAARESIESVTAQLPEQLEDVHERARERLKTMMLSILDPTIPNSMPRQLRAFTQALQEKLRVEIERKADEQVGRLVGLEERVARETKKSLESITAATAAMRGVAEALARQQADLKRAEARLAGGKNKGWLRRLAGRFS
jgi:hypothetical protein